MTFFEMGGYAVYVWPAYGISAIALIGLAVMSWRALKRNERLVELADNPDRRS